MFLADWLKNIKNVTSILMRFWSEISRMFLCMFFVDYFKAKKYVFYKWKYFIILKKVCHHDYKLSFNYFSSQWLFYANIKSMEHKSCMVERAFTWSWKL